jgi:hypothetical protein
VTVLKKPPTPGDKNPSQFRPQSICDTNGTLTTVADQRFGRPPRADVDSLTISAELELEECNEQ